MNSCEAYRLPPLGLNPAHRLCKPTHSGMCYISRITDQEPKSPKAGNPLARAVARWENEGGTPQQMLEKDKRAALAEEEEHILQCLGAAVIMRWNNLPTEVQRELFEHAVSMGESHNTPELNDQIAPFLHKHKNDKRGSD
jgi:hypothetical protein